jgi:hypothetical protein
MREKSPPFRTVSKSESVASPSISPLPRYGASFAATLSSPEPQQSLVLLMNYLHAEAAGGAVALVAAAIPILRKRE